MAGMEYVGLLTVLLAAFVVHACSGTNVHDAREEDVTTRLAALEKNQRENQAEIRVLRETVADQKNTIDKQSVKLRTLEQDVLTLKASQHSQAKRFQHTLKASQHRQVKRFQRNERLLQWLLKADRRNKVEAGYRDEPHDSVVMPPRRHGNVKENVSGFGRIKPFPKEKVSVNVPKRQASEGVAFSVYLDHDANLGAQQVIKYNKVITNEGNGYNIHTGVFTCALDGMYLFSFFIGERDVNQQNAALKVNSQNIVDATVEGVHAAQDLQGGSVWVEAILNGHHVEGGSTIRLTTFTGAFLYP